MHLEIKVSHVFMEFFTFITGNLVLNCDIELVGWVLAAPIRLHDSINKFLDARNLLVCFILIELASSPNEDLVLVVLMPRHIELRFDAEDQEGVLLQVIYIEHS